MSTKGVYTALSGAIAQSTKLDSIANNIANVNTPGFKRDQQVFQEYLTKNEKEGTVINVPRIPASPESFYELEGEDKSFVDLRGTYTDFSQGAPKPTGAPLDVAIDGDGFFEVATPQGVQFTRHGGFHVDGNGTLVTGEGFPVLKEGEPGSDPEARVIRSETGMIRIENNGDVVENNNVIARLSVSKVTDRNVFDKVGAQRFTFKSNATPEVSTVQNASLLPGFLESSNVNIVREMTDMIGTTRLFDSTQKAISAYDSMADKLVNTVPKTS